jgi:hypothetical protein
VAKSAEEGGEEDDRQGDEPLAESGKGSPQAWRSMMGRRPLYERKKKPFPCQGISASLPISGRHSTPQRQHAHALEAD